MDYYNISPDNYSNVDFHPAKKTPKNNGNREINVGDIQQELKPTDNTIEKHPETPANHYRGPNNDVYAMVNGKHNTTVIMNGNDSHRDDVHVGYEADVAIKDISSTLPIKAIVELHQNPNEEYDVFSKDDTIRENQYMSSKPFDMYDNLCTSSDEIVLAPNQYDSMKVNISKNGIIEDNYDNMVTTPTNM